MEIITSQPKSIEETFVSDFHLNKKILSKYDTAAIRAKRLEAIETFLKQGIPDGKNELYRFSNIKKLMNESGRFIHQFNPPDLKQPVEEIFRCKVTELDTYDLVTLNGWYPRTLPLMQTLPSGGVVGSLAEAMELYPELIEQHFSKIADIHSDAFTALNTAFAADGIFTWFPAGSVMSKPLQLVNIVTKPDSYLPPVVQPRNLYIVEKNASVKIVICDHTLSNDKSLTNSVSEVFVDENAEVEIYRIQNQHNSAARISCFNVHQKNNSRVTINTLTLHGGFIRNNLNVTLDGENCECNIYGLYIVDRTQHVDNNTFIDHQKPNSRSNELFKGILDEQARGVFRGMIMVRKDAQKTNSYQKNNNLLLTDEAAMNTMPQLEIYADDVKCSHGATVGYLDQEQMFYLLSRGISQKDARLLLMQAFASEIITKINIPPIRDRISNLVYKRLRGELSPCASCVLKCNE